MSADSLVGFLRRFVSAPSSVLASPTADDAILLNGNLQTVPHDYEIVLPDDIQYEIMRHLATRDPSAALRLASTSRRQNGMLESLGGRLAQTTFVSQRTADDPPTAADYLRASLALGSRSSEPDQRVMLARVARCLMEAFARLLLAEREPLCERLPGAPDPAGVVARIASDPRLGSTFDRVAAWYTWIITPYEDPFGGQPPDPISWLINTDLELDGHNGGGHFDVDDVKTWCSYLRYPEATIGIGSESQSAVDNDWHVADIVPLWVFCGSQGAGRLATLLGGSVTPQNLITWYEGQDDGRVRTVLESADAEACLLDRIDHEVAARLEGACADPSGTGRLDLPSFTSLFDMRLFLVAAPDALILMGALRSPLIEDSLLA